MRCLRKIINGFRKSYPITRGDIPDKSREPERYESFMQSDSDNRKIYAGEYSKKWYMYKELFEEKVLKEITQIPKLYLSVRFRSLAHVERI